MKIDFKKNKILQNIFTKSKKAGFDSYFNPARHWMFGLLFATFVFCVGVFLIGFDFYVQFGTGDAEVVIEDKVVTYNEKEVKHMADELIEKEHTFNELRKNRSYVPPVEAEETASTSADIASTDVPLASVELEQ